MSLRLLLGLPMLAVVACTSSSVPSVSDDAGLSRLDASPSDAAGDGQTDSGAALGQPCSIETGGCALGLGCGYSITGGCDAGPVCAAPRNPPGAPCPSQNLCGCNGVTFMTCGLPGFPGDPVAYVGACGSQEADAEASDASGD
jgi:hypothetical protein